MSTEQQNTPESTQENEQSSESSAETTPKQSSSSASRTRVQLKGKSFVEQMAALSPNGADGFEAQQAKLRPSADPLQMKGGGVQKKDIHDLAAQGTQGSGGALPHLDAIQDSFGKHDVSNVQAHTGGAAADASKAMGAEAYASGNSIAFGSSPGLHTAAHEAAHIVQQRAGVSLKGGVGEAGDSYEQHADTVADAVVAGQSAEGLLDTMAGSGETAAVQSKAVQLAPLEQGVSQSQQMDDAPYQWASAYEIEVYPAEVIVTICVQVNPDAGVTTAQVSAVQEVTEVEFERYFDTRFVLREPIGDPRPLRVRLDFSPPAPHLVVALHAGAGRDNLSNWYVDSEAIDRAHELGHQLGLRDEYVDASAASRSSNTSPGVHTDHSIMGNYYTEGIGEADVRDRHGDQLATDISDATGRDFTAEQSPTYTVRKGDTLSAIALRLYGDTGRWTEIHNKNLDQVKDPNMLHVGWELNLP
jgi:LysM repeat protein